MIELHRGIFSVLIGGKAGEGVKKAAQVIAQIAMDRDNFIFQADDYQSAIRGAHNFSIVSICRERLYSAYKSVQLIVSFDKKSVLKHNSSLKEGGIHFCDEQDAIEGCIALPLNRLMKEHYTSGANLSLSAVAIFARLAGLDKDELEELIRAEFRRNQDENISFAKAIYDELAALDISLSCDLKNPGVSAPRKGYTGNQLISLGAWAAGLDSYYSYPMTPASSILHFYARYRDELGVVAIHTESELAAANMAIGAILAGGKAAVGSSGGGIALMQEAFSLAGMVEAPLLMFLSSRPGPATGASTYSAQEDLNFALYQGHGEFPRIVASPDSYERALSLSAELLGLAWESQSPAILLTEKHLSESMYNMDLDASSLPKSDPVMKEPASPYHRYAFADDGVSPIKYPGEGNADADDVIKWNSNEHTEDGVRADESDEITAMKDKRKKKQELINKLSKNYQRVAEYGEGELLVFAYGSTVLELREAQKYLDFKIVAPIYLDPFPAEELEQYRGKKAVVVEHSAMPNFAGYLKAKLGLEVIKDVLRYDGRPFDADELVNIIREVKDA